MQTHAGIYMKIYSNHLKKRIYEIKDTQHIQQMH